MARRRLLGARRRARRIIEAWFEVDARATDRLLTMRAEITSNVTHSRDEGFAAIQRYQGAQSPQLSSRATIAVGDLGIGIKISLYTSYSGRPPAVAELGLLAR